MRVVETFAEARRATEGRVVLVPTMGYLHEGHLALLREARGVGETVVMSLFVNPLQFDDPADLDAYPSDLGRDLELAAAEGVDVVFAPDVDEMYPRPPRTRVVRPELAGRFKGAHRPGHFESVATVVTKLLAGLRPDVAVFGRKDAQQLAVVRCLAEDLSFPVEIVGVSTVREADGLALSSRNVRLAPEDRRRATALSRGLFAAADAIEAGLRDADRIEAVVAASLREEGIEPEYVALVDRDEVVRLERLDRDAFLAVAARVGSVRLIDNVHIDLTAEGPAVDRGRFLATESVLYRRRT